MREIKFRAWDSLDQRMIDWDYLKRQQANSWFDWAKLMQYTGLKDVNGKEIYEGDIVQEGINEEDKETVEYRDGFFFPLVSVGHVGDYGASEYEVIGNIYENPELIGKYPDSFTSEEEEATNETV